YDASNPNSWEGWWLRTVSGTRVIASCKNGGADNGSQPMGRLYSRVRPTDGNYHIRPTFHLSADFFENVKVKNPGAKVKELLTDWEETDIEIEAWPGTNSDSRTGLTVAPKISVVSEIKPASYKYQWYLENDLTGEEYILPWETKNSIKITSQMPLGWWLNFEVTPYDKNGNSIGKPVKAKHYINTYPMKGTGASPAITKEQSAEYHDTPSEYIFEVNGVKFILLDRLWNGEYYVMMETAQGKMKFDEDEGDVVGIQFDPLDTNNIAYWLNNDFLSGNKLPDAVKSQITEEEWTFEGDSSAYSGEKRTLKVGLLSYSEYIGYFGRFGLWLSDYSGSNPNSWEGWWLRTISGNRVFASCKNGGADNGSQPMGRLYGRVSPKDANYHIRPTFHLSADFFSTTKIDLAKAGAKVKETIAACGLSALENIYTKDELIASGTIKKPIISDVGFEGNFAAGATVKCNYVWSSENGVEEGNSSYGFSVSNTPNEAYTNVLTNSKEYTISDDDLGKYLTFYVTPYDKNGINGDFFRTKPVLIREKAKVIVTECSRSNKKIKITLKNLTMDTDETVTVMASAFDEDNNLIGCYAVKVVIPANQTVTMDSLSLGSIPVSTASVMVWDSLEKMNSIYLSDI
ncbi:MAG: hypothetical protein K5768_10320, partial [Firmicutes bacterium]|nr:hypothetical protein [Bacillota bacterium]